ncbi:chaperone protein dnaJ 2 [Culex quinquefasciatus]|uniref:Chaperone protein dnaJ 2 n=1 Tax=Culex quinquefasciatus TaxID=7176 RepID=B0XBB1_CULQU|nr:chaperone protein dnaJ 2 [Culex quinquefasciatus]|eukprot:XP_001866933.1 chaperone protein dnaJ 2 [Culex quinquefasciatus]
MGFDYYAILDIPRTASEVDIRLAYRKLAVRCHPKNDFHDAPQIPFPSMSLEHYWELLNEAFDVLSNAHRRQIYDLYGEEGLKSGVVTPAGFVPPYKFSNDCMKIYKDFFATYSPYGDFIDAVTRPPPLCADDPTAVRVKGPDIVHPIELSLEEIFHGAIKKMRIIREEFADEAQVEMVLVEDTIPVHVPPGVPSGTSIRFPEAGNRGPKIIPSDIVFVVTESNHDRFRRDGVDLHAVQNISLENALIGFSLEIEGIDGRQIVTQIVDIVDPHYVKIFEGEGLPFPEDTTQRGDLFVTFEVSFPNFIPKELREKFRIVFQELNCPE